MKRASTKVNISRMFAALSDPNRYRMFRLILQKQTSNICVGDLARFLGVTDSASSQHLRVLAESGFLRRERRGQNVCYQIETHNPVVRSLIKLIKEHR